MNIMPVFHGLLCHHVASTAWHELKKKETYDVYYVYVVVVHLPVVVVVSPPGTTIPFPFRLHSVLPPLIAYPMGRFQVLFPALAPPSCHVIAEPKLLLKWVRRGCALVAHVGLVNLTTLVSASALTDALFAPPRSPSFSSPELSTST
jgi:hypothetical protein